MLHIQFYSVYNVHKCLQPIIDVLSFHRDQWSLIMYFWDMEPGYTTEPQESA